MNKKTFIVILFVLTLLAINVCAAQEVNDDISDSNSINSSDNNQIIPDSNKVDAHIDVVGNTTFDVIGEIFKIRLADENNVSIKNAKIYFIVNNNSYGKNTNSNGFASLKLNLPDGEHEITTVFEGDDYYKDSSMTTMVTIKNTRVVDDGLSNSEIQDIIDNAKENNVIRFIGEAYSDINLVITKRITLLSEINTILRSSSNNPAIYIKGNNASFSTVKGFNIQGSGIGVKIDGSDFVTIQNNTISTDNNGIAASNVNYLNVTENNLSGNSKNGLTLVLSNNSHISGNIMNDNGENGFVMGKSNNTYIYGNTIFKNALFGMHIADKVNGFNYKTGPENLFISENTINKNGWDGIYIERAEDNINIKGNTIDANGDNGISINKIGNYQIQSNVITNSYVGVRFADDYVPPESQDVSYNAIYKNRHVQVEAKDTYYTDNGKKLEVGENWYTDDGLLCPKINTKNLRFTVTQIGDNLFQATFTDSNGNIASLLPDRVLTYKTSNGPAGSIVISGGAGTFTTDEIDLVKSTVDRTSRVNTHDHSNYGAAPINGQSQSYNYPSISYPSNAMGGGDGEGGQGSGGNTTKGNESSSSESSSSGENNPTSQTESKPVDVPSESSEVTNSTTQQQMEPDTNPSTEPINEVSQETESSQDTQASQSPEVEPSNSQESASPSSSGNDVGAGSQSVVKQIIIDEDEFFKVTGISFIILIILLTIGLYYREDIMEMKSKL
ncbi:hypothetical protein TL18_03555 [Methanobrevibacter sp. YE315]|uniref:right-handed parallel beta-helix repeat-containing protein n=1 Tax=Methanobrevibacter sp. YE315 TaxID=1609968 RepID=UPI000764DDB1|nr:right-handed parallel beta-helix repeat-containing protein [Methanobrevibacter sp. YE315]AMD17177.1 hypothetical protein TL18_03555 [Methanobrevibacter sp. YE315]